MHRTRYGDSMIDMDDEDDDDDDVADKIAEKLTPRACAVEVNAPYGNRENVEWKNIRLPPDQTDGLPDAPKFLSLEPDHIQYEYQRIGPMISHQGRLLAQLGKVASMAKVNLEATEARLSLLARADLMLNAPKDDKGKITKPTEPMIEATWKSQEPYYSQWIAAVAQEAHAVAAKKSAEADYFALEQQASLLISVGADRRAEMSHLEPRINQQVADINKVANSAIKR